MDNGSNRHDAQRGAQELLGNLKAALPELETLLSECSGHWGLEDPIYRFYHQSFKVYHLQETTVKIAAALQAVAPSVALDESFMQIVREGTGKKWKREDNERCLEATRPILEAFFHARYFLEMAVKYAKELEEPPQQLPSGWAALLCLYGLR